MTGFKRFFGVSTVVGGLTFASHQASAAPAPYHELTWYSNYSALNESQKTESTSQETKTTLTNMEFNVTYGMLGRGSFEPVIELGIKRTSTKVGDVEEKGAELAYGIGALFNVYSSAPDKAGEPFEGKRWVPYGGFLLSSEKTTGSESAGDSLKRDSGELTTVLVGGVRYILFSNVALNSQLRFAYTKSSNVGTADGKSGGTITRLAYTVSPFNVSLLF